MYEKKEYLKKLIPKKAYLKNLSKPLNPQNKRDIQFSESLKIDNFPYWGNMFKYMPCIKNEMKTHTAVR